MLYMHCAHCGKVMSVPVMRYRIYGIIVALLGVLGWRTYFFAGTGYAFLISCSIVLAGGLIFLFAHNLACRSIYRSCCPHCGQLNWRFGVPLARQNHAQRKAREQRVVNATATSELPSPPEQRK